MTISGNSNQQQWEGGLKARLAESERLARETLDSLSAHIAILDDSGTILAVNAAWREFARDNGLTPGRADAGANYLAVCQAAQGDGRAEALAFAAGIRKVIQGEKAEFAMEYPCHSPEQRRWFIGRVTRFSGEGPVRVVVAHEDITARREAEEALAAAKKAAEEATKAKSAFLANMSHEIRTPVTAIVGFAELLQDAGDPTLDRAAGLQTIQRNARHLLDLVNEILDLSKIEAGAMTVEKLPTEIRPLFSDVLSTMQPRAVQKGLALTLNMRGDVPERLVTDGMRLKQVVMNLASNAIKFTQHGRVDIRLAYHAATQTLQAEVEDSGIGMNSEQISRLFQPFQQADGSTTRIFGGTGLGLTISRRLAQLLGGDIEVRSAPGQGSVFTLTITAPVDHTAAGVAASAAPGDGRAMPRDLHGAVLIAEDGADNQRLLAAILQRAGLEVVIVDNGETAVEYALGGGFELVLMDMQMPTLDGYQAVRRLRAAGFARPILAVTADAHADDRVRCLDAGCTDYVPKPIDRALLLTTVKRCLAGESSPHAKDA
ncbi:MAG: ATP-binding protein [Phycisphaerae bacterium]